MKLSLSLLLLSHFRVPCRYDTSQQQNTQHIFSTIKDILLHNPVQELRQKIDIDSIHYLIYRIYAGSSNCPNNNLYGKRKFCFICCFQLSYISLVFCKLEGCSAVLCLSY